MQTAAEAIAETAVKTAVASVAVAVAEKPESEQIADIASSKHDLNSFLF